MKGSLVGRIILTGGNGLSCDGYALIPVFQQLVLALKVSLVPRSVPLQGSCSEEFSGLHHVHPPGGYPDGTGA